MTGTATMEQAAPAAPARPSPSWIPRAAEVAGHLVLAATFVVLFLVQAWDVYVIDETAFPNAAAGAAETGVPYFYNGETRPQDLGLWHPPLYVYSLAGWIAVFGDAIPVVRSFGMVLVLVSWAIGLFAITRTFAPPARWSRLAFSAVLLTNPLIINGALTPDIDGTWGIPVMVLGMWLALTTIQARVPLGQLVLWAAAFAYLATWAKLTIALMMLPMLLLAAVLRPRQPVRAVGTILAGSAIGAVGAIASWWVVANIAGAPFEAPFNYFSRTWTDTDPSSLSFLEQFQTFLDTNPAIFWLGPFLLIVAAAAAVIALIYGDSVVRRYALMLAGSTIFIILGYAFITGAPFQHPKYWGIAAVSAALLIALGVRVTLDESLRVRGGLVGGVLAAVVGLVAAFFVADQTYSRIVQTMDDASRSEAVLLQVAVALFIPLLVIALVAIRPGGAHPMRYVATAALGAAIAALAVQQTMMATATARADYATRHYYGERGLAEVVDYLRVNAPPNAELLAAKDVGLQSGLPFYEDALIFHSLTIEEFDAYLAEQQFEYVVTRQKWDYSQPIYPEQFAVIDVYYDPIAVQPGADFTIWAWAGDEA